MSLLKHTDADNNEKLLKINREDEETYEDTLEFFSTSSISLPSADENLIIQGVTYTPGTTGRRCRYIYDNKIYTISYSAVGWYTVVTTVSIIPFKKYLITQGTYHDQYYYTDLTGSYSLIKTQYLLEPVDSELPRININDCFEFAKEADIYPTLTSSGTLVSTGGHHIYIKLKWPYLNDDLSDLWDTYSSGYKMYIEVYPVCANTSTSITSTIRTRRQIEEGITLDISPLGVVTKLYISGYIVNSSGTKIYDLTQFSYDIREDAGSDIDKYINGTFVAKNDTTTYTSTDIYPSESEPFAIMHNCESASTNYFNVIASNSTYSEIPCLYGNKYFSKGDNYIFVNNTFTNLKGVVSTSVVQLIDEEYQVGGLFYSNPYNPTANPIYNIVEDQTEAKDVATGNAGSGRIKLTTKKSSSTGEDIYIYKIPFANNNMLVSNSLVSMSITTTQTGSSSYIIYFHITNNSNFKIWPTGTIRFLSSGSVYSVLNLSSWSETSSGLAARETATYVVNASATSTSYTFKTYGYIYYHLDSNRTIYGGRYNNISSNTAGLSSFTPTISYNTTTKKVYLTNKDNLFYLIGDSASPTVGLVVKRHSRRPTRQKSAYVTKYQTTGYAVCWQRYIDQVRYHTINHPTFNFKLDRDTGEIIGMDNFLKHFERTKCRFHDAVGTNLGSEFEGYTSDSGWRYHQNQYYGIVFKDDSYESNFSTQSIKVTYDGGKKLITGYSDD